MPGLRIAAIVTALVALAVAPAAAQASGQSSSVITGWTSSEPGTPANDPYLISYDNAGTTLSVTGTAVGMSSVDVVCYSGAPASVATLVFSVPVNQGTFTTGPQPLEKIAGQACRLRAIPAGDEGSSDSDSYAGPPLAISEAALPLTIPAGSQSQNTAYDFYVKDVTFTGLAVWSAAGTPSGSLPTTHYGDACGGPEAAPIDSAFNVGNFAVDCAGSLLRNDHGAFGGRSEVQVDGRNAYDPPGAAALFDSSQNLLGFPTTLAASVKWDPTTGLISSRSTEPWVECSGTNDEMPTAATCQSFVDAPVQLQRTITTSDGGRVVTMTDTWTSTDGKAHALNLLYDDAIGVLKNPQDGEPGYEFPGQTAFSPYATGNTLPGPSLAPASILVRSNVLAPDGDPAEADGAITFGTAPSGFAFPANWDFEENNVLLVPAGGTASLSYIYSVGYSLADVTGMALTAQDQFEPPSVVIGSPAGGTTTSSPTVTLSGVARAGSGIAALVVGGQQVPVARDGSWTAQVPLSPGTNTIAALATDGAGATAQAQVAIVYSPPSPPPPVQCRVPHLKGKKLAAAERALREAHCRVGKIKHVKSRTVRKGRVASASPGPGHTFPAGHKVELFVSEGR